MLFDVIEDIAKAALIVAALYVTFGAYVNYRAGTWRRGERRVIRLVTLILVVSAIKIGEDAITGDSGPIDKACLLFVHEWIPRDWLGWFEMVTLTGSWQTLLPLTLVVVTVLFLARRTPEALLVAVSTASAAGIVYVLKVSVGRARPSLWETEWYWGSSFPSGHTLTVAAFATACALAAARIWLRRDT
jgi:undecaprenyl-diphosphatase